MAGLHLSAAMRFALMLVVAVGFPSVAAQQASPTAATTAAPTNSFITLGTMGGPLAHPNRSQPANALVVGQDVYLVDAGDGAAQKLVEAGYRLTHVKAVFLSHHHFDHTGGLGAVLGLRYQTNAPGVLTVYGPPGTQTLVDGIVASIRPMSESGYGIPGAPRVDPAARVRAIELSGGETVNLPSLQVRPVANTHYSFAEGSPEAARFRSLSFRFDLPNRSIVYTGDTGPSRAVEQLAEDADLLVAEMIDLPVTLALIRRNSPNMPAPAFENVRKHLSSHHLSPEQVGELAARAAVRRLVITHLVPGSISPADHARYVSDIRKHYSGPVEIADDLDRF